MISQHVPVSGLKSLNHVGFIYRNEVDQKTKDWIKKRLVSKKMYVQNVAGHVDQHLVGW